MQIVSNFKNKGLILIYPPWFAKMPNALSLWPPADRAPTIDRTKLTEPDPQSFTSQSALDRGAQRERDHASHKAFRSDLVLDDRV
jgi:hypothetical protein